MHVLILTNIYEVWNSHNQQTVTLNKRKCWAIIFLPISIKILSEAPMGVWFSHFRGATGAKIKKLFEKKVKALLHNKINCIKAVQSHVYIIQLQLKNKTIVNLRRGSRRGSKSIECGWGNTTPKCVVTAYIIKGTTAGHIIGLTWKSIFPHPSKN